MRTLSAFDVMTSLEPASELKVTVLSVFDNCTVTFTTHAGELPYQLVLYTNMTGLDTGVYPYRLNMQVISAYSDEFNHWLDSYCVLNTSTEEYHND